MRAAGERKLSSFPGRNPGPSSGALRPSRGFFFFFFLRCWSAQRSLAPAVQRAEASRGAMDHLCFTSYRPSLDSGGGGG